MKTAIILAAGEGTKIWPYGVTRAKPVLPIANIPLIRHLMGEVKEAGCSNIYVVAGYYQGQILRLVKGLPGVEVVVQKERKGTADALRMVLEKVETDEFLVIYGDVIVGIEDMVSLLKQYQDLKVDFAALVDPLEKENPGDWLCAKVREGKIESIWGHPRGGVSHRLCGIYVFKRKIKSYLERNPGMMTNVQVGIMPSPESEIAESLQLAIDEGEEILAVETREFFVDLDKPWHILEANSILLNYLSRKLKADAISPTAKVSKKAEIEGYVVMGKNSLIGSGVKIEGNLWVGKNTRIIHGAIIGPDVSLGNDCLIYDYCKIGAHTSIGDKSSIGHCSEVSGVLMDRVHAVHYGEYWGVIGRATDLGAATVCGNLRFDDQLTVHWIKGRKELPLIGANAAYLGDYCRTGVNVMIMPGVKVGPYSIIGPGTIIKEDVPDHSAIYVEQNLVRKKWGPEKYGW